ncbi:MAG: FAD-dependent oxidoreductase [Candidatus Bipolaricaulota bacterium]|nr:FAD-dependent oxidoreductase [Candidatus Bipolaricaulota bacterium]
MTETVARHDVVIVGAGPAGMTAAVYAGRALRSTLVIEKGIPGGQLNETDRIENWPGFAEPVSAPELMTALRSQAERLGAEIVQDEALRIEPGRRIHRVVTSRHPIEARAVILAPGSRPRELSAEGSARLKGRGVSYCATCDGFFFQGKRVVVVGAGDSGLMEALFLTRFADSVAIVVRHPEEDPRAIRASGLLRRRAESHPKIRFLWNREVAEVVGDRSVTAVRLRRLDDREIEEVPTDGIFVSVGHMPQTEFLRSSVPLDSDGYIVTDSRLRTSIPGIFAAGDARIDAHRYAQAVIAAGEGATASLEAEQYLAE